MDDPSFRIYSKNLGLPPHFIGSTARVKNSIIAEGCEVHGTVENSILFLGVTVEEGVVVRDSIIMHDTVIKENAVIEKSILSEKVTVERGCHVGKRRDGKPKDIAVIGEGVTLEAYRVIQSGEIVEEGV